jgi:hypothetical protein
MGQLIHYSFASASHLLRVESFVMHATRAKRVAVNGSIRRHQRGKSRVALAGDL